MTGRRRYAVAALCTGAVFPALHGPTAEAKPPHWRASEQQIVDQLMRGLADKHRLRLIVTNAPRNYGYGRAAWINATFRADSGYQEARLKWEIRLVAGLARDLAAKRGLRTIVGESEWRKRSNGRVVEDGGSVINPPFVTRVLRVSDERLTRFALRAARLARAKLVSVTLTKLLDRTAVELVVRTSEPNDFREEYSLRLGRLFQPFDKHPSVCEGELITVLDNRGRVVVESGTSNRTWSGVAMVTDPPSALQAQNRLVGRILFRLRDSRLVWVRVGRPGRSWHLPRPSTWLYFDIRTENVKDTQLGLWQASLVAGLLGHVGSLKHWPRLRGSTHFLDYQNRRHFESAGVHEGGFGGRFRVATKARINRLIEAGAEQTALSLEQVRFIRPLGRLAVEIYAKTNDPQAFMSDRSARIDKIVGEINGDRLAEGTYLEVHGPDDSIVATSSYAVRTRDSRSYTSPDWQP